MPRLEVGQKMEAFVYNTSSEKGKDFAEAARNKKTALIFFRYYGCSVCQLDLHILKENYDLIRAAEGQVFAVLQSDPALIAAETEKDPFPFPIICDPDQELYRRFSIGSAKDKNELVGEKLLQKRDEIQKRGIVHGTYEGNEMQLPAAFVLDENFVVRYVRYGKDAGDTPGPKELEEVLRSLPPAV